MKFIADSMLGRLAKWLRLLGYDTLYFRSIEKGLLLRLAREEERILLTRNTRLTKIRGISNYLLLEENAPFEQLKKVITTFHLTSYGQPHESVGVEATALIHSRCSLCNTVLSDVSKEDARKFVPEYVYATSASFKKCLTCNKFYWQGTHYNNFRGKIEGLIK